MNKVDPIPTTPNPNVYRLAAKMIASGRQHFSCCAIDVATRTLGLSDANRLMHLAQYRCAFGPFMRQEINYTEFSGVAYHNNGGINSRAYQSHPYWNRNRTPEATECRVMALLLMADILEQGL